jgi:hypothetical protein
MKEMIIVLRLSVCIITSLGLWSEQNAHNSLSILDAVCFILRDMKHKC